MLEEHTQVQAFCKGSLLNKDAKTLAYLLSGYLQVIKAVEFEDRIKHLEESALHKDTVDVELV
jgi:hypothetical protein